MREVPRGESSYTLTVEEAPNPTFRRQLQAKLRAYNQVTSTIRGPDAHPLLINVHDAHGQQVGGLVAATYWNWLVIDLLVVDEHLRGQGIGRSIMQVAETEAQQRGCAKAHTSTYAFQALTFYQSIQYEIVGQLVDYPAGYTLYWLRKDL